MPAHSRRNLTRWAMSLLVASAGLAAGAGAAWAAAVDYPAPVSPVVTAVTADSVHLEWSAPTSTGTSLVEDYLIEYRAIGTVSWTSFADGVSTNRWADITGLSGTTTYEFRIGVKNATATTWTHARSLDAGHRHMCTLQLSGDVWCWGRSLYGETGRGFADVWETPAPTPMRVAGITTATAIATTDYGTCALLQGGSVVCWGRGDLGTLGNGTFADSLNPVSVAGLTDAVSIAGGTHTMCAIRTGGSVVCWGYNSDGQLGSNAGTNSATPVAVSGLTQQATALSVGLRSACALTVDGTVSCWGGNSLGQVGSGTFGGTLGVTQVQGLSDARQLAPSSFDHMCATTTSDTVYCWGSNSQGQLGDGTTTNRSSATLVPSLSGVDRVVTSSYASTCALKADATITCWGAGDDGELGQGDLAGHLSPTDVPGISGAIDVSMGSYYTCAQLHDGSSSCWGENRYGQLADGTSTRRLSPVTTTSLVVYPQARTAFAPTDGTNSAPQLDPTRAVAFAPVAEDSGVPVGGVGTAVLDLIDRASTPGGLDNVSDANTDNPTGIAITALDNTSCLRWFVDLGAGWTTVDSVAENGALLVPATEGVRLYCQPVADFSGTIEPAMTFRAWDQTAWHPAYYAATSVNGGSTSFSTATDTASLTVTAVNDAPILNTAASPQLPDVAQPAAALGAVGALVSTVADLTVPAGGLDNIRDVDAGAVTGIAVTSVATTYGIAYYSNNLGLSWTAIGSVSDTNALLLSAGTMLFFCPIASYTGTLPAAITFRAWDGSSGASGSYTTTAPRGGTTAFSTAADSIAVTVTASYKNFGKIKDKNIDSKDRSRQDIAGLPPGGYK